MGRIMILFVATLGHGSSKEGRDAVVIGDMDILRLMVYVQQVEKEILGNKEEYRKKKAKTGNEFGQQKHCTVAKGGSWDPSCAKCDRNHPGRYRDGQTGCFKCGQEGHFMRECPKNKQGGGNAGNRAQFSSVAPPYRAVPR
ncbi:DNA-binding protein HEXBP-like [Solanum pennellii]|uniref:DNA-binding protein HEXBP-like n=1 Tax=Solanum pennellii TaxID=28526 RepID=A0ABM1H761_SOLPN|nr:DNA-binding protein HEXBP-like [Solanum pennellii]